MGHPAKEININPACLIHQRILEVKNIDLFEPARLDGVHSVEETTHSLKTLVDEGLISYVGLEVNADTLRRACKVIATAK